MISYCICCQRPPMASFLIKDLIKKTTVPYEILLWMNTDDKDLLDLIGKEKKAGAPIEIVGSTKHSIGMVGYKILFQRAVHDMIVQVEDTVIMVSRRIAEKAAAAFTKNPKVKQIVADVIQDKYTTGGRPPMKDYKPLDTTDELYDGPVDGWFSVYHRSVLPYLMEAPYERVFFLGSWMRARLSMAGELGVLTTRFKVFNTAGPAYANFFGTVKDEIKNFQEAQKPQRAREYENCALSKNDILAMEETCVKTAKEFDAMDTTF